MNRNFPHAVRVVRETLGDTASDPAAAIVRALDVVGLLVDPEKSYGMVPPRTPIDDTPREHQAHQELPQRTELEAQALAWDQACERARRVAAVIQRHVGEHPAFQNLQLDGDRILVSLHIVQQSQWAQWRRYFGIAHDRETPLPYVVAGEGHRDGVRVSVLAYDLPEARKLALEVAKAPYEVEGIVYDLALPQQDASGEVWFYQGMRTADGMPLLSVDGRPERCTLANIARQGGPLTAVTGTPSPQGAPVATNGQGGGPA
ncbi:BN159_2729 family protein [Streptomyces sp. NPDC057877]|uniref:BN159_2729 family protein n=1 Tax=Streptomyces sp. NPDC057877 TaxID=3346269 RepID=UPI0036A2282A